MDSRFALFRSFEEALLLLCYKESFSLISNDLYTIIGFVFDN